MEKIITLSHRLKELSEEPESARQRVGIKEAAAELLRLMDRESKEAA